MKKWPVIIIGILAGTGVLDVILYTAATRSHDTAVEDQSYNKGLGYQVTIDELERAKKQRVSASYRTTDDGRLLVNVQCAPECSLPKTIELTAVRPSDSKLDFTEKLGGTDGKFLSDRRIEKGLWHITLRYQSSEGMIRIEDHPQL